MAEKRHNVVSTTLTSLTSEGKVLHDWLCIQENSLKYKKARHPPERQDLGQDKFKTRIPIDDQYEVIQVTEGECGPHNQVIYNTSIFEKTSDFDEHLKKAYALMDFKKKIVDWITQGGDVRKKDFRTLTNEAILKRVPSAEQHK